MVDKRTGEVLKTKYYSKVPFFYFHIANAYEDEENNIVMDINTYGDDHIMDQMFIDNLRRDCVTGDDPSQLTRFYLPVLKHVKVKDHDRLILISMEIKCYTFVSFLHYRRCQST